jgi:hypothetical protein
MSDYSDTVREIEAERDRALIVLDEVYEQRDHYRRDLIAIHEAFPDNIELRKMTARCLGHTFPNQKFRSTTL